jgi:hypothetical protein
MSTQVKALGITQTPAGLVGGVMSCWLSTLEKMTLEKMKGGFLTSKPGMKQQGK